MPSLDAGRIRSSHAREWRSLLACSFCRDPVDGLPQNYPFSHTRIHSQNAPRASEIFTLHVR